MGSDEAGAAGDEYTGHPVDARRAERVPSATFAIRKILVPAS
jgi:hypothetical protein